MAFCQKNTIPSMNIYNYQVVATDGVVYSEPATSDNILLGRSLGVQPFTP